MRENLRFVLPAKEVQQARLKQASVLLDSPRGYEPDGWVTIRRIGRKLSLDVEYLRLEWFTG
jgi:hypothetical protein